jgi:hypothetical protein
MVHWHLPQLIRDVQDKSGGKLTLPHIAREAGIAVSTIYLLMEKPPKRLDVPTAERLLTFLSRYLGPLTMNDLLEFKFSEGP